MTLQLHRNKSRLGAQRAKKRLLSTSKGVAASSVLFSEQKFLSAAFSPDFTIKESDNEPWLFE
jgi:hypothetical protein